eukprot:817055-Lingulodinium_polyedra.AAC.1
MGAARLDWQLLAAGRRLLICWPGEEVAQVRILVNPCPEAEYTDVLGEEPPPGCANLLWYALSPDLDVYPHCMGLETLRGIVPCDANNEPLWDQRVGRVPRRRAAYGSAWDPTPLQFADAQRVCGGAPRLRVGQKMGAAAAADGGADRPAAAPPAVAGGTGATVLKDSERAVIVLSPDRTEVGTELKAEQLKGSVRGDNYLLVKLTTGFVVARAGPVASGGIDPDPGDEELDARVLS